MAKLELAELRLKNYIKDGTTLMKAANLLALVDGDAALNDDVMTFSTFGQPLAQDSFVKLAEILDEVDSCIKAFKSVEPLCGKMSEFYEVRPNINPYDNFRDFLIHELGETWWKSTHKLPWYTERGLKISQNRFVSRLEDYTKSIDECYVKIERKSDLRNEEVYPLKLPYGDECGGEGSDNDCCNVLFGVLNTTDPKKKFPMLYDLLCGKPVVHTMNVRFSFSKNFLSSYPVDPHAVIRQYVGTMLAVEFFDDNFGLADTEKDMDSVIINDVEDGDAKNLNFLCSFQYSIKLRRVPMHLKNLDLYNTPQQVFSTSDSFMTHLLAAFDFPQSFQLVNGEMETWILKDFSPETIRDYAIRSYFYMDLDLLDVARYSSGVFMETKHLQVFEDIDVADVRTVKDTTEKILQNLDAYKKAGQKLIAQRCNLLKPNFLTSYVMEAIQLDPTAFADNENKIVSAYARSLMV